MSDIPSFAWNSSYILLNRSKVSAAAKYEKGGKLV
jgi:hypothetical protein